MGNAGGYNGYKNFACSHVLDKTWPKLVRILHSRSIPLTADFRLLDQTKRQFLNPKRTNARGWFLSSTFSETYPITSCLSERKCKLRKMPRYKRRKNQTELKALGTLEVIRHVIKAAALASIIVPAKQLLGLFQNKVLFPYP